jgi:hypothetical protein
VFVFAAKWWRRGGGACTQICIGAALLLLVPFSGTARAGM